VKKKPEGCADLPAQEGYALRYGGATNTIRKIQKPILA
jgi:hypothetical protein